MIALAYRRCPELTAATAADAARASLERDLRFVGFLAFRCLVRKDSKDVLLNLRQSSHHVTMVTGDAPLTGQPTFLFVCSFARARVCVNVCLCVCVCLCVSACVCVCLFACT